MILDPDAQGPDAAPIPAATRTALLAELEGYEHLLFEPMAQADLDGLYALYDQWRATLGDSPEAIALCDALDSFIEAGIEDGDVEQAYRDLVATVQEGVPEYVQLQVMHQLAVTGQQAADVAVLLGGHELQIHRIERDEAMIDQLISLERQFWDYVETDTPPPADGSDSADQALRALFPQDDGETVDFSDDVSLSQAFVDLQRVRRTLDDAKQEEARLKHRLQQAMGTATLATFPSGGLSWKQTAPVTRLDTRALQKDHPGLCADYLKTTPGSRRFVVRR